MFDLVLFVFFSVMAYRISNGIRRESLIFSEFRQPRTLALLVMLFPLGPVILILGLARLPAIAVLLALACYLPALAFAHRQGRFWERAGTDRVQKAQAAASQAFGSALAGLIYVAVVLAFTIGAVSMSSITQQ